MIKNSLICGMLLMGLTACGSDQNNANSTAVVPTFNGTIETHVGECFVRLPETKKVFKVIKIIEEQILLKHKHEEVYISVLTSKAYMRVGCF